MANGFEVPVHSVLSTYRRSETEHTQKMEHNSKKETKKQRQEQEKVRGNGTSNVR